MQNKQLKTIRKRSVEYAQFRTFRVLTYIFYFIFGVIIIVSFWFLYTRMYQTIGQVESLVALSPVASVEPLNIEGYETVEALQSTRANRVAPSFVRDPFNVVEVVSSTIETTTTSTIIEN